MLWPNHLYRSKKGCASDPAQMPSPIAAATFARDFGDDLLQMQQTAISRLNA
jgi:hypothetical protein